MRQILATLNRSRFDAAIFDLEGVITSTQQLRADAWKRTFDEVTDRLLDSDKHPVGSFTIESDYYRYVDDKPPYHGVRQFLEERGVELPFGEPTDEPEMLTVCAIVNRKDYLFKRLLEERGTVVYPAAISLIKKLRGAGFGIAVVSSNKNCTNILAAAGALELFHTHIDGNDCERRKLSGKPAPDVLLAAAQALDVPAERAVVVDDAIAGVQAGRAGNFGMVIGVDRRGQQQDVATAGADVVVENLSQVGLDDTTTLPASALLAYADIRAKSVGRKLAVFLDYDGTLTPIVDHPEEANLGNMMRRTLLQLSTTHMTAIISGRDLDDVRRRIGLEGLIYAGSHGLDIQLSNGDRRSAEGAESFLSPLDHAGTVLEKRLETFAGAIVERKRFAVAVHYRLVASSEVPKVKRIVDDTLQITEGLKKRGGKSVFELLPDIEWHKGTAVRWLLSNVIAGSPMPIYIGDDLTDEDAFHAVRVGGVGIAVMATPRATAARFSLPNTDAVQTFLMRLAAEQ